MALVLDATVGGSSANSLATVAAFRAWLDTEPRGAAIAAEADEVLALLLAGGTNRLEQESYHGSRVSATQALAFPRYDIEHDGLCVDSTTVPRFVQYALFHEALDLYTNPTKYNRSGLAQFVSVSAGPISVTPRVEGLSPNLLTPDAARLLSGVLANSGGSTFRWLRA